MIRRGATRPHPRTRRGMGAGTVGSGASRRAGSAERRLQDRARRPRTDGTAPSRFSGVGSPLNRASWGGAGAPGASGAADAAPPGGAPDRRADDDARRIAGRRGDGDDPQRGGGGDGGASDAGRPARRRDAPRRRDGATDQVAPAADDAQRDAGRVADGDMEPPGCAGRNDDAPQRAAVRAARDAHGEPDVAMQRRRRADAARFAASAAVIGTMSGACSAPARTGAGRMARGAAPGLLRFVARRAAAARHAAAHARPSVAIVPDSTPARGDAADLAHGA